MAHGHNHRWTNEEMKKLVKMWQEDKTLDEISVALGSTKRSLAAMVVRLRSGGIPLKKRQRGHKFGKTNTSWSQADVEYLVKRREAGGTVEEIAVELERSFYGVQALVLKLKQEGVALKKFGSGKSRLWDSTLIRAQLGQEKQRSTVPFRKQA